MTKQEFLAMSLPYCVCTIDRCDFENNDFDEIVIYNGIWYSDEYQTNNNTEMLPILRPLTDLTKPIKQNGEVFIPILKLGWSYSIIGWSKSNIIAATKNLTLTDASKLISWHFDIAGLIEKGEAIDVNKLNNNLYK